MWCGSGVLKPLGQQILKETQGGFLYTSFYDQNGILNYAIIEYNYWMECILSNGLTEKKILYASLADRLLSYLIMTEFHPPNNLKTVK